MKKLILFMVAIWNAIVFAQNLSPETAVELTMEKNLSERIEKMLEPLVGKTIVSVNLELKYPTGNMKFYGTELNLAESLPGIPVSKSAAAIPAGDEGALENQIRIISQKVSIHLNKRTGKKKIAFIKENLPKWIHLDPTRGDELTLEKDLSYTSSKLIVYAVIIFFMLLFLINFRAGIRFLAVSLRNINIKGFDKALHIKGGIGGSGGGGIANANLQFSQEKPLPVEIVQKEEEDAKDKKLNFHFVENLSLSNFSKLIAGESNEDIAFLIANLSPEYVQKYITQYPLDSKIVIRSMLNVMQRSKAEIEELRDRLYEKYESLFEEERYTFDGKKALIKIINSLPSKNSEELYREIHSLNPRMAEDIRINIFLIEDILKLDNDVIKAIIKSIHHNLLVTFLASTEDKIREKFTINLTKRAALILEEDIELLGNLSQDEKEKAIDEMLATIRMILKYI